MSIEQGVKIIAGLLLMVALAVVGTLWWMSSRSTPPASVQAVGTNACNSEGAVKYYDGTATIKEYYAGDPDDYSMFYGTLEVAGADTSAVHWSDNPGRMELIFVDNQTYQRDSGYSDERDSEWKPVDFKPGHPLGLFTDYGSNPLCPDVSKLRSLGTEKLDDVVVQRYTQRDEDGGPHLTYENAKDAPKTTSDRPYLKLQELLVDVDGQLHKVEMYYVIINIDGRMAVSESEYTFSGIARRTSSRPRNWRGSDRRRHVRCSVEGRREHGGDLHGGSGHTTGAPEYCEPQAYDIVAIMANYQSR